MTSERFGDDEDRVEGRAGSTDGLAYRVLSCDRDTGPTICMIHAGAREFRIVARPLRPMIRM